MMPTVPRRQEYRKAAPSSAGPARAAARGAGSYSACPAGRRAEELRARHNDDQADHAGDGCKPGELEPITAEAVNEGGADAQAHAIHEQIIEHRLGEIVELELYAVGRSPD